MQRIPIKFALGVLHQASQAGLSQQEIRREIYPEYGMPGVEAVSPDAFYGVIHRAEQVGVNILAAYHNAASLLQGMMSLMPLQTLAELNAGSLLAGLQANLAKDGMTATSPLQVRRLTEQEVEIAYQAPIPQLQNSLFIPMGSFLILKSMVEYYLQGTGEQADIRLDLSGGKAPGYERDLLDRLALDCRLKRTHSVMYIRTPLLQTPFRYFNPLLASLGCGASAEKQAAGKPSTLIVQVQTLLKQFYGAAERFGERCELDEVARRLEIPAWTLKRRLAAAGSSFLELHQQILFERACELLREPGVSLEVISNQLGFASQSSLTRFFKQCAGVSPLKFRRQH